MAVAVLLTLALGVGASDPVDLNPDDDLQESGVDGDPYVITNASELQAMGGNLSAHYKLGNDVDASETEGWNNGNGFNPIGDNANRFTGHFDGKQLKQNSTISAVRNGYHYSANITGSVNRTRMPLLSSGWVL